MVNILKRPYLICAIGDIHGQYDMMVELHELIIKRHKTEFPAHDLTLVHVGDFIDRGAKSFQVIERLIDLEQEADFNIVNLRGNHEQQFVDVYNLDSEWVHLRDNWLSWGGAETVASYEAAGCSPPYKPHVDWINALPIIWKHEASKTIFVHAGIEPQTYPEIDPDVVLWTRDTKFMDVEQWDNEKLNGWSVVHGHTPTKNKKHEVFKTASSRRINIDSAAVYGGALTAVLIREDADLEFMSVESEEMPWRRL